MWVSGEDGDSGRWKLGVTVPPPLSTPSCSFPSAWCSSQSDVFDRWFGWKPAPGLIVRYVFCIGWVSTRAGMMFVKPSGRFEWMKLDVPPRLWFLRLLTCLFLYLSPTGDSSPSGLSPLLPMILLHGFIALGITLWHTEACVYRKAANSLRSENVKSCLHSSAWVSFTATCHWSADWDTFAFPRGAAMSVIFLQTFFFLITNSCRLLCLFVWQGRQRQNTQSFNNPDLAGLLSWANVLAGPLVVNSCKHMRGKEHRQTMKKIYIGKTALKVPRNGGKHPKKR